MTGLLTDTEIKQQRALGDIAIEPFDGRQLSSNSYDVRLGEWYYRETEHEESIYNPRDEASVARAWGKPQKAMRAGDWMTQQGKELAGIDPEERIIWIGPGESLLAHTQEFIGFRRNGVTSMQARSSFGRSFLVACSCAGTPDKKSHYCVFFLIAYMLTNSSCVPVTTLSRLGG